MTHLFQNKDLELTVSTTGAEMLSLVDKKTRTEYLWHGDPAVWKWHTPVLFPVCGNFPEGYDVDGKHYTLPQHGFLRDVEFHRTTYKLFWHSTEETKLIYPYPLCSTFTYIMHNRTLTETVMIHNTGTRPMPYSVGFHAGFALDNATMKYGDVCIKLDEEYLAETKFIPSPNLPIEVQDKTHHFILTSDPCTTWVIWSAKEGKHLFTAIEPRIDTEFESERHPFAREIPAGENFSFSQTISILD